MNEKLHIVLVAQYFWPEEVGPAIWLEQLACTLTQMGHKITMLTAFPNYPSGIVAKGYTGKRFMREQHRGVDIVRNWIYSTPNRSFASKSLTFASFCVTSFFGGLTIDKPDVVYAILPPLPLGITTKLLAQIKSVPLVVNVQDIYPDIAINLGYVHNRHLIQAFRFIEQTVYRSSAAVVVITESFRNNLLAKGVPAQKIHVVPNWADSNEIYPTQKCNGFREELGAAADDFLIIYSGGFTHNTSLETVIEAARILNGERYRFVLVGDGVKKPDLQKLVAKYRLTSVTFVNFQPLNRYPDVLAAADIHLASLNMAASNASLPSKVLKIMSSGRPTLALTSQDSDLSKTLRQHQCGWSVHPDDYVGLADKVREISADTPMLHEYGVNARRCLIEKYERMKCIEDIERILLSVARPLDRNHFELETAL